MLKEIYDPELLGLQIAKLMGSEALVYCPFHSDRKPSAEYNLEKGLFYCFGCQTSKTAKQLARELGGTLVPVSISSIVDERRMEGDLIDDWINLTKNPLALDNDYLKSRKVSHHSVANYGIMENSDGVIFPITDRNGRIIGVQVRHYNRQPKYQFYGERQPVWPMLNLWLPGLLVMTEGVFGAVRANEFGNLNAVASMGAGSADSAGKFIKKNGMLKPVAIMDTDFAGEIAAGKLTLIDIPVLIYPKKWSDPDEWSEKIWLKVAGKLQGDFDEVTTLDVNKIISRSKEPKRLEEILKKYWRKINE